MAHRRPSQLYAAGAFLLAVVLALLPVPVASKRDSTEAQVVRIIDGASIEVCCLASRPERIRYIGVNTPEMNHPTKGVEAYRMEATEANRRLVAWEDRVPGVRRASLRRA